MTLTTSAHVDTFTRDHLPPAESWPTLEFTLPELQYPDRLNAATVLIDDAVAQFGAGRPALHTPDGDIWTYGELLRRANQVAQVLTEDLGVVPGNRVLLRGPNNPWIVAAWLGVLKAGAVVVTTMPMLRSAEISTLIGLTKPAVAISDHRFVEDLRTAAGDDAAGHDLRSGRRRRPHRALCRQERNSSRNVETAADDVALLGPTSGTTGVPKVTMHFHRDILANADTFARHLLQPTAGRRLRRFTAAGVHLRARRPGRVPAAVRRLRAADRTGHAGGARRARPPPRTPPSCSPHPPPTGRS